MQRRILLVAIVAVALAVTLLGVPLAFVQRQLLHENERAQLLDAAVAVQVDVPRNLRETGGRPPAPDQPPGMHLAIYDGTGRLLTGHGPPDPDEIVRRSLAGEVAQGFAGNDLIAAVPVQRGEDVVAVVRASSQRSELVRRETLTLGVIVAVAAVASLLAILLALRLAARLTTPVRDLQQAAEELGDGNFAVQAPISGIGELDAVSAALNATAQRLGQLVTRERAFSANASHQLRTPLTALRLRLDAAVSGGDPRAVLPATTEALAIVDDLETTVEDLLAVARGRNTAVAALDLGALLGGLPHRWEALFAAEGRSLVIRQDDPPIAAGRAATVRQVLDVLIDNAYRHGGGTVQVVARDASGALAIDVVDEGRPEAAALVDAEFGRISAGSRADSRTDSRAGSRADTVEREGASTGGLRTAELPTRRGGPRARGGTRRGGTGIGLGLARSLLVADGGRLLLTATPGRTCATMLLPAVDG